MSPTLFIVLYFTFIPNTVSFVALSDVLNSKTLAPVKLEFGYVVVFEKLMSSLSNISNRGCWLTFVFVCPVSHEVVEES